MNWKTNGKQINKGMRDKTLAEYVRKLINKDKRNKL